MKKGMWIRAQWMNTHLTAIAGVQPKLGGTSVDVSGIVEHIRGDHPTNPTSIRLFIRSDADGSQVLVDPDHVVDIRDSAPKKPELSG